MLLFVKKHCISIRCMDLERNIEMVVSEIESSNPPNLIVAVFYRPPGSHTVFQEEFEAFLRSINTLHSNKKFSY